MGIVLGPALLGATWSGLYSLCWRRLRRPAWLAASIALGFLVAWEALLLNALSLLHLVVPWATIAGHLIGIALLFSLESPAGHGRALRRLFTSLRGNRAAWMLAPLSIILLVSAFWYSPSTPDSMAYHLARVAHWIGNRSVAYYPTSNPRQNYFGPGAEYLLLALQIVARSDLWANFVQLAAYFTVVFAIAPLSRLAGLPRRLAPWASLFVAGLPMAVLQATTTQNDLVASAITIAIVSASIPFMHRRVRWRPIELVSLAILVAAGYLVKPTSVLAAAPFLLFAAVRAARGPTRLIANGRALVAAGACFALIAGPDLFQKVRETGSVSGGRQEVYPLAGLWKERFLNGVVATCAQLDTHDAIETVERRLGVAGAPLFCKYVFLNSEDRSGDPLQFSVALAFLAFGLVFAWRLTARERLFAGGLLAAWICVHLFVRNQEFVSRLQLPILVLTPFSWVAFYAARLPGRTLREFVLAAAGLASVSYGLVVASNNVMKPLSFPALEALDRTRNYYLFDPPGFARDASALEKLRLSNCRRLGLYLKEGSYDYPITWRALLDGVAVRHYLEPSDWPCMIYSDRGPPPAAPGRRWVPTDNPALFVPEP
jgi:hypothetical protein